MNRWAVAKLIGLFVLGLIVFLVDSAALLTAGLAALAGLALRARIRPLQLWRQVRAAAVPVGAIFVAHAFMTDWQRGGVVALRLSVVIVAASIVTLTTRVSDLLAVIEAACRPLRPLGVEPTRVALVLAMAIRFVPLLGEKLAMIRSAQRARGVERPGVTVFAPLLVETIRMAEGLADALDARGLADAGDQDG